MLINLNSSLAAQSLDIILKLNPLLHLSFLLAVYVHFCSFTTCTYTQQFIWLLAWFVPSLPETLNSFYFETFHYTQKLLSWDYLWKLLQRGLMTKLNIQKQVLSQTNCYHWVKHNPWCKLYRWVEMQESINMGKQRNRQTTLLILCSLMSIATVAITLHARYISSK